MHSNKTTNDSANVSEVSLHLLIFVSIPYMGASQGLGAWPQNLGW